MYDEHLKEAGFVEKLPLRTRSEGVVRRLFLRPEVVDLIDGKISPPQGFPTADADRVLGLFSAGWVVRVTQRSAEKVDLEKLENLDEAWALCFRRPRPGWRILGRFIDKDAFVGLGAHDRHVLGKFENYTAIATQMIEEWSNIFPDVEPHRGVFPDDYISGVWINADG